MPSYRLQHVDAFTRTPFTGNYAGVLLNADGLSDEHMQLIAREKNVSETAFVLKPSVKEADVRIRWFTPAEEVPLCGHATIATFHALAEEGELGMGEEGTFAFRLETKSGILGVSVEKRKSSSTVEFELPVPNFAQTSSISEAMMHALGLGDWDLDTVLPVVSESYLYVPLKSLEKIQGLRPDFSALSKACRSSKVLGVSLFSLQTLEPESSVHSRFFAPSVGINEDPVTGSANGPLGAYLHMFALRAGFVPVSKDLPDGRTEYVGEQGDEVNRPGRVRIRLKTTPDRIERLWIAGEAVTVMQSTLSF